MANVLLQRSRSRTRTKRLKEQWRASGAKAHNHAAGLADALADNLSAFARSRDSVASQGVQFGHDAPFGEGTIERRLVLAGLDGVDGAAARAWRVRNMAVCTGAGALLGSVLSPYAGLAGAIAGGIAGWESLGFTLSRRAEYRKRMVEGHLSEAVEVLCLCLRSGLSVERSLETYCVHYRTPLSAEFELAQQTWRSGLLSRQLALRNLAATYDSLVFERMVDAMVRSLRFGTPLADSLDELAKEARKAHKAHVEEAVMKAPVKMMMPIGLLILPSMLLLVMGPILLELVNGF